MLPKGDIDGNLKAMYYAHAGKCTVELEDALGDTLPREGVSLREMGRMSALLSLVNVS